MKPFEKTDPLTGEIFNAFRANQVFATDENRIRFNNLKAKVLRNEKSNVERPLHKNFQILKELMLGKTEECFHKQFLLGRGYNFSVLTHNEMMNGKAHIAIYNFIIAPVDCEQIKIFRK